MESSGGDLYPSEPVLGLGFLRKTDFQGVVSRFAHLGDIELIGVFGLSAEIFVFFDQGVVDPERNAAISEAIGSIGAYMIQAEPNSSGDFRRTQLESSFESALASDKHSQTPEIVSVFPLVIIGPREGDLDP